MCVEAVFKIPSCGVGSVWFLISRKSAFLAIRGFAARRRPEASRPALPSFPKVSICLECNSSKLRGLKRKWIRCSAQATVLHLKKFIAKKLNLSSFNEVALSPLGGMPELGVWGFFLQLSLEFKLEKKMFVLPVPRVSHEAVSRDGPETVNGGGA